ncbi:hypothetical protein PVAND_009248 [Polypedilum vanderplanki]|uniref:Odorant receptor n=1 Tax=Polypedilum vanderplanki TaxID=319348 RepID=A0A9J6CCI7_POLVA|nr:hypothetical protein PVAND_009248 [Polypedilum vanderplanki]
MEKFTKITEISFANHMTIAALILCNWAFICVNNDDVNQMGYFILLGISAITQIFLPCFIAQEIQSSSEKFLTLVFHCDWIKANVKLKKDLLFFMSNLSLVIKLNIFGIVDLNLNLFLKNDVNHIGPIILLSLFVTSEIFIPCYVAQKIESSSENFTTCIFQGQWIDANIESKKNLLFLMGNLSSPVIKLKLFGIVDLNLKLFVKIINAAFSYYTLLNSLKIMKKYSKIATLPLASFMTFAAFILCTSTFTLVNNHDGNQTVLICMMILSSAVEILLPCYVAQKIESSSEKLVTIIFHSQWLKADIKMKKNLLFFMSYPVVKLNLFGVIDLNLKLFVKVDVNQRTPIFMLMFSAAVEIFLPCYVAQKIESSSKELVTFIFHSQWLKADIKMKKNLLFFMCNSLSPILKLNLYGIVDLNLKLFLRVDVNQRTPIFMLMFSAAVEIFLPCYVAQKIESSSEELVTFIFHSQWLKADIKMKKNLLFFMCNSLSPILKLNLYGIVDLNLKLFLRENFRLTLHNARKIQNSLTLNFG